MDHTNNFFADNQQFNAPDNLNLFQSGSDSNFNDASWGINASEYGSQSRGQLPPVNGWQQNANQLSVPPTHASYTGQASPYGRSLNQSPVPFNQNQYQNYANQQQQQSFQQPYRQSPYDQSLFSQPGNGQSFNATIVPQALDRDAQANFGGSPYGNNAYPNNTFGQMPPLRPNSTQLPARPVNQQNLIGSIPKGADSGMFRIVNFDNLARATNSERMGNYVNVGKEAVEMGLTRSAVPAYTARKSRKELRAAAAGNPTALAKIGKSIKKEKKYPTLLSDLKSASASASSKTGIKQEQDSTSSEEPSSDDDSEYTDDEEEEPPLPAKRPGNPKAGVEYDTIKALWRPRRKQVSTDTIKEGLVNFWELIKGIRDRWKKDSQDVTDAENKKQTGQLPLLQSRVKDQRDMIEVAFKTALKHGHRDIVEVLSQNSALMFVCYQMLLDRFKADDTNCGLVRAILETISLSTRFTTEKIEKTHLVKVLSRYAKRADAKTQFYAKKILANAKIADEEEAKKKENPDKKEDEVPGKPSAASAAPSDNKPAASQGKRAAPEVVAGVKRPATSSTGDGSAQKKVATLANKTNGTTPTTKVNGVAKKGATGSEAAKSTTTNLNAAASRKVAATKPSGFFSGLQSAAKKPGTSNADRAGAGAAKPVNRQVNTAPKPAFSFAETMANLAKPKEEKPAAKPQKELPPETPEEREKRLRKEKRRKLHVTFKTGEDLVQIRYFTHDPQEEIGHDSSQMRDMSDVGGEGRVLKQHAHMMDIDEEDDAPEEMLNLKEYTAPSLVDFSVVDPEERNRNYAPYGGGEQQPESAERAVRDDYENNNLIVFYTDPSQIPPNPREPFDINKDEPQGEPVKHFAAPQEKFIARAQAKKNQQPSYGQPSNAPGGFDLSAFMKQQQPQPQQQASAAPMNPDVASILASLQKVAPPQATQPQPPAPFYNQPYMGAQPPASAPAPPPANIDLGAILASLNAPTNQQGNYGNSNAAPMMGYGQQAQQPMTGNAGQGQNDTELAKIRAKNPNYKTKVCRFWHDGRCQKGDSCHYLHD